MRKNFDAIHQGQKKENVSIKIKTCIWQSVSAIILSFLIPCATYAQQTTEKVQMADGMRSSGKIYVVVAVLLTVLTGLILYLVRLDKKISRLEKQTHH